MNREALAGTGKVFGFTLKQMVKNKSSLIVFAILALLLVAAVPVMSLMMGGNTADSSKITTVFVLNETSYQLDVGDTGEFFAQTAFQGAGFVPENAADTLDVAEVMAYIHSDERSGSLLISLYVSRASVLEDGELTELQNFLSGRLKEARLKALDATEAQLDIIMSDFTTDVMAAGEYNGEKALGIGAHYSIQYTYSIVVMLISMFSTIYIIRAIIEEKASKLVELLMVSVKPLALILGKILAVMAFIFSMLVALVVLFALSCIVSGLFLDLSPVWDGLSGMGLDPAQLNIGPGTVVVVLVSLLLGYLTFSILAGLAGTACSSMEDVESANMTVVLAVLFGYLVSSFLPALGGDAAVAVASLIPIVSVFCAPVHYITGNIGIGLLCLSWAIQAVVIVIMAVFCARVYQSLIMSSGGRVKFGELITMYRRKEA